MNFRANNQSTNGSELWKSDGTAVGTVLVKDIWIGNSSNPNRLTDVNGTLFFRADNGTNGEELWKSDGTSAGTVLVKDINPGTSSSEPNYLININGTLFFRAYDGVNGYELWKSDGTSAGTVLVKDIWSGSNNSSPEYLTNVNGTLFFRASDGSNGVELWKSDGTSAGTVMVKDINPGSSGSLPGYRTLTNVNGTLFFAADDGTNGIELWKYDIPPYTAEFISFNSGNTIWCPGETRSVSITVKNTGSVDWAPGVVNMSYWWNGQNQDDNPRIIFSSTIAAGETRTINVNVTAPLTSGSQNLTLDVVREGVCWFRNNTGSCGPGNVAFVSPTILVNPTWYLDADNDSWYSNTQNACVNPGAGWSTTMPVNGSGDCNDNNAAINPGAAEICGNGIDEDCSGSDLTCPIFSWTGNTNTNWDEPNNWSGGVPTSGAIVEIPSGRPRYPSLEVNPTVADITIATNATLTIPSGQSLTVSGVLTNNGTITVNSGGSLVQGNGSTLAGTGTYVVQRDITAGQRFIGSPINNHSVNGFGILPSGTNGGQIIPVQSPAPDRCNANNIDANSPYGNIMELIENAVVIDNCAQSLWHVKATGNLTNARGYAVNATANTTLAFTGTVNNDDRNYGPLGRQAGSLDQWNGNNTTTRGWHLVSNPYPSPITFTNGSLGADFDNQIQLFDGSSFTPFTLNSGSVTVAVGQGFQIRVAT